MFCTGPLASDPARAGRRHGTGRIPVADEGDRVDFEMAVMTQMAPLDLRVNRLKGNRLDARSALSDEGVDAVPTPLSPTGLRVYKRIPLATLGGASIWITRSIAPISIPSSSEDVATSALIWPAFNSSSTSFL